MEPAVTAGSLPNLEIESLPSIFAFPDKPPKKPSSVTGRGRERSSESVNVKQARAIAREIAREEIDQEARVNPRQSYEDMKASLVAEILPILLRQLEPAVMRWARREMESTLPEEVVRLVQETLAITRVEESVQASPQEVTKEPQQERIAAPTELPKVVMDQEHEDTRRWLNLMREASGVTQEVPSPHGGTLGDDVYPGLIELKPLNERFTKVLSYRTYRLRKRDSRYDDEVAQGLSKTARQLKHVMTVPIFTGEDPIAVLAFLKNFKFACDETGVAEGAALPLMKYFMGGEARETMLSYVGRGTGFEDARPGVDVIYSYPEAVNWLLLAYAKESVLQASFREVTQMRQVVGESEDQFAFRLRKAALRCGDAFQERSLMAAYIDGLSSYSQHVVRDDVARNPRMSFQDVRMRAQSLGDTARETHRIHNRFRTNLPPVKSARRVNTISLDSEDYPMGNENAILTVGMGTGTPASSESPPTTAPRDPGDNGLRQDEIPARQPKPVNFAEQGGAYNGVSFARRPSQQKEHARPGYPPKPQGGATRPPLKCLICRKMGHVMTQCRMLPQELRMAIRDAQAKEPYNRQELAFLRALTIQEEEGGAEQENFGSGSSSDSLELTENDQPENQ